MAPQPCGSRSTSPHWHVVVTYAQAERRAITHLTQQGYETWLPLVVVTRRDRVLHSLWHRVEVPLFPRYAFARFDADTTEWYPIRNTPGVCQLILADNGKPAIVPEPQIRAVQAAIAERAANDGQAAMWVPGMPAKIALGAFAGHPAVVLSVTRVSARVAILALGALREAVVPLAALTRRE